jgi:putative molybdopterin biosynthesis protein
MEQSQFLDVIDRDEAERRFGAVLDLRPLAAEQTNLSQALGRVLARDIVAPIDVPGFDRSNVDGFAVRAEDTFGASELAPRVLHLNAETLATGKMPRCQVVPGTAAAIATGAVLPRGADAIVMIEDTDVAGDTVLVRRPATPGANITFAGTDIGRGETVLHRGSLLTSRETGVLAALGLDRLSVVRRPRVAILSTGDELIAPGSPMRPGGVFDSNATVLADAVRELGGEPVGFGIVPDSRPLLSKALHESLTHDVVLLSGGTSKGPGDLCYQAVHDLGQPGIVVHGVALKPGKPLCLAAIEVKGNASSQRRRIVPVVILPGFPTSALFTFHEFVAPIIRSLGGRSKEPVKVVTARLPFRVNSERGRTEYVLVSLVSGDGGRTEDEQAATSPSDSSFMLHPSSVVEFTAYPMEKGSGSLTTFSRSEGFIIVPRQREYLEASEVVEVQLFSRDVRPVDLVVIGSHCTGLDYLLSSVQEQGFSSKCLMVGSTGGLLAARRGECDVAGIHLFHAETDTYNRPYLNEGLVLIPGYGRLQGIVFRRGDTRFEAAAPAEAVARALADPACVFVNRNRGSGTRALIDRILGMVAPSGPRPAGYLTEARSHNAVIAAVVQGRADWGVAITNLATDSGLGYLPLQAEQFDFVIPRARLQRPAVQCFCEVLQRGETRRSLAAMGFHVSSSAME